MRFKQTGPGREYLIANIVNNEGLVTIKQGAPVFADPSSSGLKVLSAEALPDAKHAFFFGLAITDVPPGSHSESLVFGFFETGRILLRSRAASSDAWPAIDAVSAGAGLDIITDAGVQALYPHGLGVQTNRSPFLVLAADIASAVSVASTSTDSSVYSTTTKRVQVRSL